MATLTFDHRRLSYEDTGAGPIALLIHGSPGNAKAWARVAEKLAATHRVIAIDLPGYGETTPQPAGQAPDVGYAAELIEALVQHAGTPAVLAGHSYGGVVALAVALRGKVQPGALALFEPVALNVLAMAGESDAHAAAKAVFDDYIASFEGGNSRAVEKMIDFWFGPGAFGKLPEPAAGYLVRETAANIRDVRATFRETYPADGLRKLDVPVLVVAGERSPPITHLIARVIAGQAPRGKCMTMPKATHALTSTHADAVAEAIANAAQGGARLSPPN